METEDTTQKLQNKVDKLKLLNLTSNIHNLTPPVKQNEDPEKDIALVRTLSSTPRLLSKFLEIRGMEWDPVEKKYIQIATPIMNVEGAYRFVKLLKQIAEETEWASYSEEEITSRIIHHFEVNIPYFTFWSEEYELDPRDFGYIINALQIFIDASFHKAKAGKYINTIGRTYDEGIMKRALETEGSKTKKDEGFLSKYNPFKNN